jgi:predicted dehydrogenase
VRKYTVAESSTWAQPAITGDGRGGNWRLDPAMSGGGILVDHGWHAFYILNSWMAQVPTRVSARLETRRHTGYPLEDTATVQCEFARATGEVYLTWAADERRISAELLGSRGVIHVEDSVVVLRESGPRGDERRWTFSTALSDGSHHPDWFGGVAGEFVAGVGEKALRWNNLTEASLCVELLAAAQESSRQGGAWLPIGDAPTGVRP